jgi:transposase-like protein
MVGLWKGKYKLKAGGFSKKKEISLEAQELKALKKELKNVTMECDILKKAESKLPKIVVSSLNLKSPRATFKTSIHFRKY